jgi:hypothetical protein
MERSPGQHLLKILLLLLAFMRYLGHAERTQEYKYMQTLQICSISLTSNGYGNKIFDVTAWVNLTMETARSSETSANFHRATPHIPEDIILHSNLCENPKSCFWIANTYTASYFISYDTGLSVWLCNIHRQLNGKPRHFLYYTLLYFPLPSPLLLSRPTCYRMIHRGRSLMPSPTNSQPLFPLHTIPHFTQPQENIIRTHRMYMTHRNRKLLARSWPNTLTH